MPDFESGHYRTVKTSVDITGLIVYYNLQRLGKKKRDMVNDETSLMFGPKVDRLNITPVMFVYKTTVSGNKRQGPCCIFSISKIIRVKVK